MKKLFQFTLLVLLVHQASARQKFTISGDVTDTNGEPLIGAAVFIQETFQGGVTNFNGKYEITGVAEGRFQLVASLLGFEADTVPVEVGGANPAISFRLKEQPMQLEALEVVAERVTERTAISNVSFRPRALQTSQGLTEDPLRTLATLPGVGRGGDLFSPSQLYIRGGAPDENLFLMDNNKVHFPYYFGGQKSIINTDAVESIELLTGGFSAMYGNHMSSVMNVQTRDGDFENYKGNASVGFYNAAALVEGPIVKEKLSALVAVRRTYLDLFLDESAEFPVVSFGDVTYKVSYNVTQKSKLALSGLSSTESVDFIAADQQPGLPNKIVGGGKNHFQSLQLKSAIGSGFYNKLSVTNTLNNNTSSIGSNVYLNIDAWQTGLRDDFTWFVSNKHKLKTGFEWQYGSFDFNGNFPIDPLQTDPNDTTVTLREIDVHDRGEAIRSAYALYDGNPLPRLGINMGLRVDQNPRRNYSNISPRLALNYQLTEKSKLRFSTGIYSQFPGSEGNQELSSSRAIHYIAGYEHRFANHLYGWIEAYHKDYQNLVYYDEQLNYSNDGEGTARGIELFIRKEKGKLRGWVAYSLSHSERKIPLLDEVKDFEFDQRHIFNLVAEYYFSKTPMQWYVPALVQLNFRYADGTPYTPVTGAIDTGAGWTPVSGEPLSLRNSDYLNLNVRLEWRYIDTGKMRMGSFIEVWNALNAKNVQGRSYQYGSQYPNNVNEQPYHATPFLPAGGFRVEFGER